MKPVIYVITILVNCVYFHVDAQIHLNGYKCKFYKDQWPYTISEMCSKEDTFRFTLFSRDIWAEEFNETGNDRSDRKKELEIGLQMCFENDRYTVTRIAYT